MSASETTDFNKAQRQVLTMPAIWILALSSAFMYISRYAVNSWGVFYLEAQKDIPLWMPVSLFPLVLFVVLSALCFPV